MADYVSFRDAGFWHTNTVIEIWCSFLVEALDARPEVAMQLADARDHWNLNATIGWNPVDLDLDGFCELSGPRQLALTVFETAIARLRARDAIPKAELEARQIGGGSSSTQFRGDFPTADVAKLGAACALLLKGSVRPTPGRAGLAPWSRYFAGTDAPMPFELRRTPPSDWDDDARGTMTIAARHALWQLDPIAPGASDADVRRLEAALGTRLPADYRELLQTANGSKGKLRSGALVELWPSDRVLDATQVHREQGGAPQLVFIGGDGSRERLCFDTRSWPPAVRLLNLTLQTEADSPWVRSSLSETIEHLDRDGWSPH